MSTKYYKLNDNLEVMDVIEKVTDGLNGRDAFCLGNIIKYVLRAGKKTASLDEDLTKANDYAHQLCKHRWRASNDLKTAITYGSQTQEVLNNIVSEVPTKTDNEDIADWRKSSNE